MQLICRFLQVNEFHKANTTFWALMGIKFTQSLEMKVWDREIVWCSLYYFLNQLFFCHVAGTLSKKKVERKPFRINILCYNIDICGLLASRAYICTISIYIYINLVGVAYIALNSLEITLMTHMKLKVKLFKMQQLLTSLKYTICAI